MTESTKDKVLNIRLKPQTREEFRIAAELRGATMSSLIHQFVIKTIREERIASPEAFAHLNGGYVPAPIAAEIRQKHLFSAGENVRRSGRAKRELAKDVADARRDARERTKQRKAGQE